MASKLFPDNYLHNRISDEVKKYIGYAYLDDFKAKDYLTIDKRTFEVSHTQWEIGQQRDPKLAYYDMSRLIQPAKDFGCFEPDSVGIDIVVLDFFPNEKINYFMESATEA